MSDKQVTDPLAAFVCLGVKNDEAGKATWERYKIQTTPTVLFVDPEGAVVDAVVGYANNVDFAARLVVGRRRHDPSAATRGTTPAPRRCRACRR